MRQRRTGWAAMAGVLMSVAALTVVVTPSEAVTPGETAGSHLRRTAAATTTSGRCRRPARALRRVTDDPGDDILPAWSPDGTKIAFTSNREGAQGYDIFVMNADGTGLVNLTNSAEADRFPAWSRDGSRIAYMSKRDGNGNFEIYVMNADGSDPQRLTDTENIEECCLDWSPGDDQLVFQTKRDGNFELYTMNADGSEQTNITNPSVRRHAHLVPGRQQDRLPQPARRRQRLLHLRRRHGGDRPDLSALRRLEPHPGLVADGTWSSSRPMRPVTTRSG